MNSQTPKLESSCPCCQGDTHEQSYTFDGDKVPQIRLHWRYCITCGCSWDRRKVTPTTEPAAAVPVTPEGLHPDTASLITRFASAMAEKLHAAEIKYGYSNFWMAAWETECRQKLHEHLAKGDPRDVANYCAFMWHHGWSTIPSVAPKNRKPPCQHSSTQKRDGLWICLICGEPAPSAGLFTSGAME